MRFLASRSSARSASVRPGRLPSWTSAAFSQLCRHPSEIPKSFASWFSGTPALRATATTSSRNSLGYGFGMIDSLPARTNLTGQVSTKVWAVPEELLRTLVEVEITARDASNTGSEVPRVCIFAPCSRRAGWLERRTWPSAPAKNALQG